MLIVLLFVATHVPLLPAPADTQPGVRFVPVDTWIGAQFPGMREAYRTHLAPVVRPRRLPMLALFVVLLVAAVPLFPHRLGTWLAGRVPVLSPAAQGFYRLSLGLALLAALLWVKPPRGCAA